MTNVRKKGTGTVVQIGDQFYARWTVSGERVYGKAHDTRDAAELDRITNIPAVDSKPVRRREVPTLQDWIVEQHEGTYGQVSISAATLDLNETIALNHIDGTPFGKKRINRHTRRDCQAFADGLRKANGERPSAHWVRRVCALVSKMFSLAIEAEHRRDNPMEFIILPKVSERINTVLDREQAIRLVNATTRLDTMIAVSLLTGLRRGELCRIEWDDIKTEHLVVRVTKPVNKSRLVPLMPEVKSLLESQPRRCEFVFSTENGTAVDPHNLTRDFKKRKKQLGIPEDTRLQDMRGSFTSLLFEGGADPRAVMEILGHSSIKTTMGMYARSNTKSKQRAVLTLRESLDMGKEGTIQKQGLVDEVSKNKREA